MLARMNLRWNVNISIMEHDRTKMNQICLSERRHLKLSQTDGKAWLPHDEAIEVPLRSLSSMAIEHHF